MQRSAWIIGLAIAQVFIGCDTKTTPPQPPVPVNLLAVRSQPVVYFDRFPATTVALSQVNLLAQVQGYVTGINFKEGTHVRKGQILYELDKRIYEANERQADANLKVAQGNLVQAKQDADRYTYLNDNNAVARQLYDHAIIALDNAKSQVHAAEEALKTAKANLVYATITAPFDGTIGLSQVKLGDFLNPGTTILNTISTDDPMAVDFLVNEKQLPYFEKLQSDKELQTDSLFTLIMPDNTVFPISGKISVIDRAVDPQTGSIKVRLVYQNPGFKMRAGMSCVVKVRNQETTPQMVIPNKAIVEQMGEYFVYIVKDTAMMPKVDTTAKDYKPASPVPGKYAFQKKVKLGATIDPMVIVKSGISEGEQIVVDGLQSLHDGTRVALAPAKPNGTDGAGKKEK